jgi:hypothetical protein
LWAEPQDSPHVTPERDDRNSGDESDTSAELNRTAALWTGRCLKSKRNPFPM